MIERIDDGERGSKTRTVKRQAWLMPEARGKKTLAKQMGRLGILSRAGEFSKCMRLSKQHYESHFTAELRNEGMLVCSFNPDAGNSLETSNQIPSQPYPKG